MAVPRKFTGLAEGQDQTVNNTPVPIDASIYLNVDPEGVFTDGVAFVQTTILGKATTGEVIAMRAMAAFDIAAGVVSRRGVSNQTLVIGDDELNGVTSGPTAIELVDNATTDGCDVKVTGVTGFTIDWFWFAEYQILITAE